MFIWLGTKLLLFDVFLLFVLLPEEDLLLLRLMLPLLPALPLPEYFLFEV